MKNGDFRIELLEDYKPIEIKDIQQLPKKPTFSILSLILIPAITISIYIVIFKAVIKSTGNFYLFFVISAAIGVVTSIIRYLTERNTWEKECRIVEDTNSNYIKRISTISIENGEKYKQGLLGCYPSINSTTEFNWIRTPLQKSYLSIRLGEYIGINPSYLYWKDENLEKLYESTYRDAVEKTKTIVSLPYVMSLKKHKIIGVYGVDKDEILNNIIMSIILFHSEENIRMCIINDNPKFSWCKRIPHANCDKGISLYAESANDIYESVTALRSLIKSDIKDMNIIVLTSDLYLQVHQIRDIGKYDQVVFVVLCDDKPNSYCDVAIGNNIVLYSDKVAEDCVILDTLPLEKSIEYVRNNKMTNHQSKESLEEKKTLPEYIDAFAFFGNPISK